MAKKRVVGRPPKYASAKQMQKVIDEYFLSCQGEVLRDRDGEVLLNKGGFPIILGERPPTITGLALALGFTSRQALLNYQEKPEFVDTITRAKSRVEQYVEERLFDKDGANGAKFSLANNFEGWKERKAVEADINSETVINIELVDDE